MALRPLNILSCCSGAGGLELGIRIAEPRARGVCFVEREIAAAASLVASMEAGWFHPSPVWSDLATFDGRPWRGRVHCIASGDPCQPNSNAGKRLGADDDRFLIDQVVRIVDEVRPDRVFRENVTGNFDGQLAAIVPALERLGYRVAVGIFSAAEVGASHRRERGFIMADRADGSGWLYDRQGRSDQKAADAGRGGERMANAAGRGFEAWSEIGKGGDVDVPRQGGETLAGDRSWSVEHAEVIGRGERLSQSELRGGRNSIGRPVSELDDTLRGRYVDEVQTVLARRNGTFDAGGSMADTDGRRRRPESNRSLASENVGQSSSDICDVVGGGLADADDTRSQGIGSDNDEGRRQEPDEPTRYGGRTGFPIFAPGPSDPRWPDIIASAPQLEPSVRRMAHGMAHRIERLRAAGNGVVPLSAAYAWRTLSALLAEHSRSALPLLTKDTA